MRTKSKSRRKRKCDYCNNNAVYRIFDEFTYSYLYFCEDCYAHMQEDNCYLSSSILGLNDMDI